MTLSQSSDSMVVDDHESNENHQPIMRAFAEHTPKWQRFQVSTTTSTSMAALPSNNNNNKTEQNFPFQRQYSHVYHQRLAALKPRCWESMERDSGIEATTSGTPPPTRVSRILELREDVPSQVVGTLVKECGLPDEACLWTNKKCRSSDYLVLEDESGRVTLEFDVSFNNATVHQYCTGLVVGVRGIVGTNGVMKVEKFYYPAAVAHPSIPPNSRLERDAHVLLLSGLQLGDPSSLSLARDMLLFYLDGMLQPQSAAKICRVVIAGGSIAAGSASTGGNSGTFQAHHYSGAASSSAASSTPQSIQELDAFCAQILAMGIPVDLLPGRDDPTTATWPQRPLHSSLFPFSRAISAAAEAASNFYQTPNPYAAVWGDKLAVGTDGTNVIDLVESTNGSTSDEAAMLVDQDKEKSSENANHDRGVVGSEELEALAKTLEWGHICPTGPDSVPTMPHAESDPLVIRETPHVYFMGNAKSFSSRMVRKLEEHEQNLPTTTTRLVCVPQFGQTGQAVLVRLETLDVQLLRFVAPHANN